MKPIPINLVVEDSLSEAVLRNIIKQSRKLFSIGFCYGHSGFAYLKKTLPGFNRAARGTPFLVLTDLDRTECPPIKIREWLQEPKHHNLLFRIAVKEVEAWLLADRINFARFLGISKEAIPDNVEEIEYPKEFLINIAKRSRKRSLREYIIPLPSSTAKQGPNYNGCLIYFIDKFWNIKLSMQNSPSLKCAVEAIQQFEPLWVKRRNNT